MKHADRLSNSMYDDQDWRASWLSDARAGCLPILLLLAVTLALAIIVVVVLS